MPDLKDESLMFALDDGQTVPLTVIIDGDGVHISQDDYQAYTDEITISWQQMFGLFQVLENIEGMFSDVRH